MSDDLMPADLEALLAAARTDLSRDLIGAESVELAGVVVGGGVARRRRRRARRLVIAATIATLVTAGSAAAVRHVGAHTGTFGDPVHTTEEDGSEWLNVCAADFGRVIATHQPRTPMPPGYSWQEATTILQSRAADNPDCEPGGLGARVQETNILADYADLGRCAWIADGVAAVKSGDAVERRRASVVLSALAESPLNHLIDGGGVVEHDTAVAAAVGRGELNDLLRKTADNCAPWWAGR